MTSKIHTIISYVESGETEEALDKLVNICKEENLNLLNEIIVIKNNCADNNKKYHTGLIAHSEWQLNRNNINHAILSLLKSSNETKYIFSSNTSKYNTLRWLLPTIIILLSITGIYYFLYYIPNTHNEDKDGNIIQNTIVDNLGLKIYPDYKDVYINEVVSKKTATIEKTKSFIQNLMLIDDNSLALNDKIYREIAITISYKILSLLSDNTSEKIKYSGKGIESASKAKLLVQSISTYEDIEKAKEIQQWVDDERHESRILINDFILKCVDYKYNGGTTKEELMYAYNSLPSINFLSEEGYDDYPIIKWFSSELINE